MTQVEIEESDSQVNWYRFVVHDENLYMSEPQVDGSVGSRIGIIRANKTVRVIDAEYFCEELAHNRVSGFHSLSDDSLKRIQETNGMETTTRISTRWRNHWCPRPRGRIVVRRQTTFRESIQTSETILIGHNTHMDPMVTWANER